MNLAVVEILLQLWFTDELIFFFSPLSSFSI